MGDAGSWPIIRSCQASWQGTLRAPASLRNSDGNEVPLSEVPLKATAMFDKADDEEKAPYLVRINWIQTIPLEQAIKERGFFGNQNTVCKPTSKKWEGMDLLWGNLQNTFVAGLICGIVLGLIIAACVVGWGTPS